MNPSVWLGYVLGRGDSIRVVADNRRTIGVGIVLVLLTSIARNYDQTFILEKPFLWFFGSLLFSIVSGTWLYLVVYGWFLRRAAADADGRKPAVWAKWPIFMGLFWMTAPIAWLYAIPVERFFDSLAAAKANLMLLAIVSLWRVILMTRVVQFLTGARWFAVLLWVLFAAVVEILVVFAFGGAFAKALMQGMGGLRNSPEENLMVGSLATVFGVAFWAAPVLLIAAFVIGRSCTAKDFPVSEKSSFGSRWLLVLAAIWVGIAVKPQLELARNVQAEKLIAAQKYREALNYMGTYRLVDFAPARVLPPNAYEWNVFTDLPACFGVVQANDPVWVQKHLMQRFHQMLSHYTARWERKKSFSDYAYEDQVKHVAQGLGWYGPDEAGINLLLDGLERMPEGKDWLTRNFSFVEGVCVAVTADNFRNRSRDKVETQQTADRLSLSNRLHAMGATNLSEPRVQP